jgi:hypothetical protein
LKTPEGATSAWFL